MPENSRVYSLNESRGKERARERVLKECNGYLRESPVTMEAIEAPSFDSINTSSLAPFFGSINAPSLAHPLSGRLMLPLALSPKMPSFDALYVLARSRDFVQCC